jgi:hypothetical protein
MELSAELSVKRKTPNPKHGTEREAQTPKPQTPSMELSVKRTFSLCSAQRQEITSQNP